MDITLAAPPKRGLVPSVTGGTLAAAAHALSAEHLGNSPQPANAGDDWVVIRQDPAPGSTPVVGTKVTLAVENRTPAATPTPSRHADPDRNADPGRDDGPDRRSHAAVDRQGRPGEVRRRRRGSRRSEAEPDREGGDDPAAPG